MGAHRRYKPRDFTFARFLITLRRKANLTQGEVAIQVGVAEKSIRNWEGGCNYPTDSHLLTLIKLYLNLNAFTPGQEQEEAQQLWEQLRESSPHQARSFDEQWFAALLQERQARDSGQARSQLPEQHPLPEPLAPLLSQRTDWGEAMDVTAFYGRDMELATLSQWVLQDRCRLVILLGMGGIGKTALSIKFAQQAAPHFSFVFWRSMHNAPPFEELITDCIQMLSDQQQPPLPQSRERTVMILLNLLRKNRCLFVLDNAETLLQAGSSEGRYREEYEGYRLLIQRLAEVSHQSCLLLTSREMPNELVALESTQSPVRALKVSGLGWAASQELLKEKELFGTQQEWENFIQYYSGNPLALKMAAGTVREVCAGNIASFLRQGSMILPTVRQILDYQFDRLSPLERDLMYWLAIERDWISLEEVSADLIGTIPRSEVLTALQSLRWRCLLERTEREALFTLHQVVLEYVTGRLMEQICNEIIHETPELIITHALMKTQSKDYIRDSQIHMLIQPILSRLRGTFGDDLPLEQHLRHLVHLLRGRPYAAQGYSGGNMVNLLAHMRRQIKGIDFSHLSIREGYLQGIEAQNTSFAEAEIINSLFTEPLEGVASLALSPSGDYLAVGSFSGQIRVWRVADSEPLQAFRGHDGNTWALAFSPDNTILASGGYDHSVKLWAVGREDSGHCLRTLQGHTKWVRSVAFSPDGTLLATSGEDEMIRVWDMRDGTCVHTLHGHVGIVWAVTFNPDGTLLVTSGEDGMVRVWNVQDGTCIHTLQGHNRRVLTVAFHPQRDLFVSGGEDGHIRLWNVKSGRCLTTLELHTLRLHIPIAVAASFSPDGKLLAVGRDGGVIEVWQVEGEDIFQPLRTLLGHPVLASAVAFGPDNLLASASYSGKVKLWEAVSGRCLRTFQGYSSVISALAFSPQSNLLVQGDSNGVQRVWEVKKEERNGKCLSTFQGHADRIWSLVFSPDGKTFASGGDDGAIKLWKVGSGSSLKTFPGHLIFICSMAFSPDGSLLASGSFDQTVKIWSVDEEDGKACLRTLYGHTTPVWSVAFSPDGRLLASGGNKGEIKLWNVENGECLKTLHGGDSPIGALIFSPDGTMLISCGNDESAAIWYVSSGNCYKSWQGRGLTNWVNAMAFSRDGTRLAVGSNDHTVKFWQHDEVRNIDTFKTFRRPESQVWSVAFSPDGHLLASGYDDGTLIILDVQTGTPHQVLRGDRPYERMNIHGVKGLTAAQKSSLKALGAIEEA